MIYTIGYGGELTPERLHEIVKKLGALLVDCRHNPVSRKSGFGRIQLGDRIGWGNYKLAGHMLGGRGNTNRTGIAWLQKMDELDVQPLLLLCMEEAPGECHRHSDICAPHFPDAIHIYQNQLIRVRALTRAEEEDSEEYEIEGSLEDLLNGELKLS